jgi:hypothetical protein
VWRRFRSTGRRKGRHAVYMANELVLRDPEKGSISQLKQDIATVRDILVSLKNRRGKQKGAFVSDLNDWFFWMFALEEELRERLGVAKRDERQSNWRGFVDVKMTDEEKQLFAQWDVHDNDLFLLMSEAVAAGHKLSISFNKQNDTFVCSFTGNDGTGKHEGYTLTAYAGDWYIAVRALVFKHAVLLNSDWTVAADRPSERLG